MPLLCGITKLFKENKQKKEKVVAKGEMVDSDSYFKRYLTKVKK